MDEQAEEEVVPQWVLDEEDFQRRELGEAIRREEEAGRYEEEEEDEAPLEVDMGDEEEE